MRGETTGDRVERRKVGLLVGRGVGSGEGGWG